MAIKIRHDLRVLSIGVLSVGRFGIFQASNVIFFVPLVHQQSLAAELTCDPIIAPFTLGACKLLSIVTGWRFQTL